MNRKISITFYITLLYFGLSFLLFFKIQPAAIEDSIFETVAYFPALLYFAYGFTEGTGQATLAIVFAFTLFFLVALSLVYLIAFLRKL
ncbi:MAG: hypothetical protein AB8F78_01510 [Saprospiraceae bacterium]